MKKRLFVLLAFFILSGCVTVVSVKERLKFVSSACVDPHESFDVLDYPESGDSIDNLIMVGMLRLGPDSPGVKTIAEHLQAKEKRRTLVITSNVENALRTTFEQAVKLSAGKVNPKNRLCYVGKLENEKEVSAIAAKENINFVFVPVNK